MKTLSYPTLSVIIPTCDPGRPLRRCLGSIASQPLLPGDEVLVVGDTTDGPLPAVEALVAGFGPQFRYLDARSEAHTWGHGEINLGIAQATGDYLLFQDDDDCYVSGAFDAVRRAAAALPDGPRPLMFRFVTRFRTLLWATPEVKQDWIGGHNLVTPNLPGRLGRWTERYQGDYDFIRETVDLWPGRDADVVWREDVLTMARPNTPIADTEAAG